MAEPLPALSMVPAGGGRGGDHDRRVRSWAGSASRSLVSRVRVPGSVGTSWWLRCCSLEADRRPGRRLLARDRRSRRGSPSTSGPRRRGACSVGLLGHVAAPHDKAMTPRRSSDVPPSDAHGSCRIATGWSASRGGAATRPAGSRLGCTPWASRKTSCSAHSRSATSGSCGCGSPTCWASSSPWRWRRPSSRAPSPRASASTARPSRASPGSTSPTCWPSPTRRRSRSCRGAARRPSTARMFCDIVMPDGSPSYADPRYVLKRTLSKAADKGFTFYTHPEIEFYLFKDAPVPGAEPVPVDRSGYFDHTAQSWAPTSGARRSRCSSRWASRWSSATTRAARPAGDRPALRRRAEHGRQHHDLPHGDP